MMIVYATPACGHPALVAEVWFGWRVINALESARINEADEGVEESCCISAGIALALPALFLGRTRGNF
jgi:hypothetical protein